MSEALMYKTQTELEMEGILLTEKLYKTLTKEQRKDFKRLIEIIQELAKREVA